MKDNFSTQSDHYAAYRPGYPQAFFDYLRAIVPNKCHAWDCGTGNGQVAYGLAKLFDRVDATDISASQIAHALRADNIVYSVQPAEKTVFGDGLFDLVVAAQAIHWFDFDLFYREVRRTAKEGAIICVAGYGRIMIDEELDRLLADFYENTIGRYWDAERRYVDEHYRTIPFPFKETSAPSFVNVQHWTREHLTGYLNTWSAVKHFTRQNGYNPVVAFSEVIGRAWGEVPVREVRFPLFLRTGFIHSINDRLLPAAL